MKALTAKGFTSKVLKPKVLSEFPESTIISVNGIKPEIFLGFRCSINWHRNLDRNWHVLAEAKPISKHPALMIKGDQNRVPKFEDFCINWSCHQVEKNFDISNIITTKNSLELPGKAEWFGLQ